MLASTISLIFRRSLPQPELACQRHDNVVLYNKINDLIRYIHVIGRVRRCRISNEKSDE